MKTNKTIRAMKDKNFRAQLSPREQHALGAGPSGIVELDDQLLEAVGGGSGAGPCGASNNGCGSGDAGGAGSICSICQK